MNISFGICKTACVVQNKTLVISDKSDINYLALDKLQKSKNRITMITGLGRSNRCKIKKIADKEYQITLENPLMKSRTLVSDALVDYQGSSWIIEKQSFSPKSGRVEALLKLKDSSKNNKDKENFSILYLDNKVKSDYLEFSIEKNLMTISKDVSLSTLEYTLNADVIEMNINTRKVEIFMLEGLKKVKIKSIK